MNKAMIIGNLTKDPEMKTYGDDGKLATFGVATNKTWKDKDGIKQQKVEFHNVIVFGKLAEVANKYLKKGNKIYVEGEIETSSYDKDGITRYKTSIIAKEFEMLTPKPTSEVILPKDNEEVNIEGLSF